MERDTDEAPAKTPARIAGKRAREESAEDRPPGEEGECAICLGEIDGEVATLECAHWFHLECIREWMRRRSVCPLCRGGTRRIRYTDAEGAAATEDVVSDAARVEQQSRDLAYEIAEAMVPSFLDGNLSAVDEVTAAQEELRILALLLLMAHADDDDDDDTSQNSASFAAT